MKAIKYVRSYQNAETDAGLLQIMIASTMEKVLVTMAWKIYNYFPRLLRAFNTFITFYCKSA